MRGLAVLLALILAAACSTKLGKDGRSDTTVDVKYLAKTEIDRIADTNRSEVVDSLLLIADKLYKRNPKEWKKAGQPSREAALERLRTRHYQRWPELNGLREGQAASLAFNEAYTGDRVAALMFGLLTMVDAAYEHKEEFYILDSLNETKLYNSARNMDVAVWKLGHDRNAAGELFLLSNELDPANRNLSFEREFGRVMGLLDFMAKVVADRNGRGLSRLTQTVVSTIFLPVSFLK
ncbi:hypothetical protein LZ012_18515 [Dechloromonas sp. XY25]|uniref:Lipoprotein n=1 Tax=Dechloromonas hankyongensis TaxID=2908002 RepID=A0ABS9K7D5_9RHOO|nr:hypothetical protein [Dechloromonas hankyongensis]MCG2578990.1 hypothetical protein [Dechloromonas hankyongensis]